MNIPVDPPWFDCVHFVCMRSYFLYSAHRHSTQNVPRDGLTNYVTNSALRPVRARVYQSVPRV